jgi:hypothetical protein
MNWRCIGDELEMYWRCIGDVMWMDMTKIGDASEIPLRHFIEFVA